MVGEKVVAEVLTKRFFEVGIEYTISYCQGLFKQRRPKALVVVDRRGKYVGMLSEREMLKNLLDPTRTKVKGIYRRAPSVQPSSSLAEAARLMVESDMMYLPVLEGGKIAGLITDDAILKTAATMSYGSTKLGEVMTRDPATVSVQDSVGRALSVMRDGGIAKLPIMREGKVVGVLTLYDALTELYSPRTRMTGRLEGRGKTVRPMKDPVSSIMSSPVISSAPSDTVATAVATMTSRSISSLVITGAAGGLVGLVTKRDLLRPIAETAMAKPLVKLEISIKSRDGEGEPDREKLISMLEVFAKKHERMLIASVVSLYVKSHRSSTTGSRTVQARMLASGPSGQFSAVGEGWESGTAVRKAMANLERRLLRAKEMAGTGAYSNRLLNEALGPLG